MNEWVSDIGGSEERSGLAIRKRMRMPRGPLQKDKENPNISGMEGAFIRETNKFD